MEVIECTASDAPLLAEMNRQLIEDEKAETDLSVAQLEERMKAFIASEYRAFFFKEDDRVVGYALCKLAAAPVYLRQFFINRGERRRGCGRRAFHALLSRLEVSEIDIDVFTYGMKRGRLSGRRLDLKGGSWGCATKKIKASEKYGCL